MRGKHVKTFFSLGASTLVGAGIGYKLGFFHGRQESIELTLAWADGIKNLPPGTEWGPYVARWYNNAAVSKRIRDGYIDYPTLGFMQQACSIDPKNPILSLNLVFALLNIAEKELKAGNFQSANDLIHQAQQAADKCTLPKDEKQISSALSRLSNISQRRVNVSRTYEENKANLEMAIDLDKKAFQKNPNKFVACRIGEAYLMLWLFATKSIREKSTLENSIQWYEKAIELDSEYRYAYYEAGHACIHAERISDANSHLSKAFARYSRDPKAFAKEYVNDMHLLSDYLSEYQDKEKQAKMIAGDRLDNTSNVSKRL